MLSVVALMVVVYRRGRRAGERCHARPHGVLDAAKETAPGASQSRAARRRELRGAGRLESRRAPDGDVWLYDHGARSGSSPTSFSIETTIASRAHPAERRRALPPMPGNPRKRRAERPAVAGNPRNVECRPHGRRSPREPCRRMGVCRGFPPTSNVSGLRRACDEGTTRRAREPEARFSRWSRRPSYIRRAGGSRPATPRPRRGPWVRGRGSGSSPSETPPRGPSWSRCGRRCRRRIRTS